MRSLLTSSVVSEDSLRVFQRCSARYGYGAYFTMLVIGKETHSSSGVFAPDELVPALMMSGRLFYTELTWLNINVGVSSILSILIQEVRSMLPLRHYIILT